MKYDFDRIYNVDCYTAVKDIPDCFIDCVYIDIPYLHTQGGKSEKDLGKRYQMRKEQLKGYSLRLKNNVDVEKYDVLRIDKYKAKTRLETSAIDMGIDYSILDELCRVMKKINIFIWCSKLQILDLLNYFVGIKKCNFDLLVWAKTNAIPTNNSLLSDIEYCLYFRSKGVLINTEYENKSRWFCSSSNKKDKVKFKHPTIKPLKFVESHIKLATKENDIVLDCFLGSGTTAVACKNLNRHYIGFEKEKDYFDIALDRLNNVDANGVISMFPL